MIEQDTVKLLRECDSGIKMGIGSIEDVYKYVTSENMKTRLDASKREHEKLSEEIENALSRFGDDGKNPNPIAKGMSHLKTEMKLLMNNK